MNFYAFRLLSHMVQLYWVLKHGTTWPSARKTRVA
jgi:hypothetical protein